MANKENQHYVPKFYLKGFSHNGNKKQIGILNLKSGFYFQTATLKNQASRSYFYGKDLIIEDALGILESAYSLLVDSIIKNNKLPKRGSFDHYLLTQFIIITGIRNPIQSKTSKESFDKFIELLKSRGPRADNIENWETSIDGFKKFAFSQLMIITEMCLDLEFKLLKNNTKTPFITSDNPLIKYNQFLEKRKFHGSATGFASLGLQLFIPLSPELLIIGYDHGIYKIGNRKQEIINVIDKQDIDNLNILQFINCYENVLFNHLVNEKYIRDLHNKSNKFPKANIGMAEEYPLVDEKGIIQENQTISVMYTTDCKTKLDLSFVSELRQAKLLRLENRAVHLRKKAEQIRKKYST